MEFWGLEVQPGQAITVNPGDNKYLHLSQISLGEVKKEKTAAASVFVKFDDKKLVLGTLSADKCSQIQSDLVFEKEFELFHGLKNTSVYFLGYKTAAIEEDDDISDSFDSDSESEEEIPLEIPLAASANGKPEAKANDKAAKPNAKKAETSVGKAKVKVEELEKDDKPKTKDDEDDDDTEEDDSEDDESKNDGDEEMVEGEDDDSDDEDESSDEEEEATPKKAEVGKKRPVGSPSKTPVPGKKAKLVSPHDDKQKPDGKKDRHVATPFPAKQGKTQAISDKSKQQTPKSTGSVACKSCSKTFNSENALQSHTKAKHSTVK